MGKEFADAANRKMEEERKRKEEEENALTLQIVHPNCFEAVDGGKKLTMRPFIESLLKKMLRFARDKKKVEENEPILDDDENENKKIEQMFADRQWPEGLSGKEIDDMVTEHYKEHSIYLKCDGRQNVETLLPAICEEMKRCDEEQKRDGDESIKAMLDKAESMQLHLVKIPSVFNDV